MDRRVAGRDESSYDLSVVETVVAAALSGMIGNAAYDAVKAAARSLLRTGAIPPDLPLDDEQRAAVQAALENVVREQEQAHEVIRRRRLAVETLREYRPEG